MVLERIGEVVIGRYPMERIVLERTGFGWIELERME